MKLYYYEGASWVPKFVGLVGQVETYEPRILW